MSAEAGGAVSANSREGHARPLALFRSSHPGPSIAVTVITVGLGFAAGLDAVRLVLLGFSMLAGQFSVGLSNDWIDADRDATVGRKDKPIAAGWISGTAVRNTALLRRRYGGPLAAARVDGCGGSCRRRRMRLGLQRVAQAVGVFDRSVPDRLRCLPAIATLARPVPAAPALWTLAVGALLGAAGHFANTLPDLVGDAATGVRGLPQRLGRRWSSGLTYLVLLAASVLEFFGTGGFGFLPADVGLGIAVIIAIVGGSMLNRPTRWHFRLIIIAAVVDVVVLILAGSHIVARLRGVGCARHVRGVGKIGRVDEPIGGFARVGASGRHGPVEIAVRKLGYFGAGVVFFGVMHWAEVGQVVVGGLAAVLPFLGVIDIADDGGAVAARFATSAVPTL